MTKDIRNDVVDRLLIAGVDTAMETPAALTALAPGQGQVIVACSSPAFHHLQLKTSRVKTKSVNGGSQSQKDAFGDVGTWKGCYEYTWLPGRALHHAIYARRSFSI